MSAVYSDFLLEQARKVRGVQEFEDFQAYSSTPEEARDALGTNAKAHYNNVKAVLDKMASYGSNHWWVTLNAEEAAEASKEAVELRKQIRVYYQIFNCGIETLLVSPGQLANDINDVLVSTGIVVTTWILRNPVLFQRYKEILRSILKNDKNFMSYLKKIDSG